MTWFPLVGGAAKLHGIVMGMISLYHKIEKLMG